MQLERRIFFHTLSLSSGQVVGDLLTFVFLICFARTFGAAVLGQYSLAMAVMGMIGGFVGLGLNSVLTREVSRHPERSAKFAGNFFLVQMLVAVVLTLPMLAVVAALPLDDTGVAIFVSLGVYHLLYRLAIVWRARFRAHQRMVHSASLEALLKLIIAALGIPVILLVRSPGTAVALYPLAAAIVFVLGLVLSGRMFGWPDLRVDVSFLREGFRSSLPIFAFMLVSLWHDRIGVVVLRAFHEEVSVGTFSAGERLVAAAGPILSMFGAALLPTVSRLPAGTGSRLAEIYRRCLRVTAVGLLPGAALVVVLGEEIIGWLYGDAFSASVPVLQIVCWAFALRGLTIVMSTMLIARNRQGALARAEAVVFGVFLLLCLVTVPAGAHVGLAVAILASNVVRLVLLHRSVDRDLFRAPLARLLAAPLLASAIVLGCNAVLAGSGVLVRACVSGIAGATALWMLRAVRTEDLALIRRVLADRTTVEDSEEPRGLG